MTPPLRVAFFGRSNSELSVIGLSELLCHPSISVVAVSCGRGEAALEEGGRLQEQARRCGLRLASLSTLLGEKDGVDLVLSCSNPVVFPASFIARLPYGALNLHPAPLPHYRGCHGLEHALVNGDLEFGASLHYCDSRIDSGPIVEVRRFPIEVSDTAVTLWEKVDRAAAGMLRDWLGVLARADPAKRTLPSTPQDPHAARYYDHHSFPADSEVNPNWRLERIRGFVRACLHPGRSRAYLPLGTRRLTLTYESGHVIVHSIEG